ncbi:MAG TPA: HAD family hydrolase [Candidatus Limnocylindria bacterium]|nr:HAD family hydrolase [Candidatus Limnocylindria bacterium]
MRSSVAFLFDVDNTLLDNDRVKAELAEGIDNAMGEAAGARFWAIYEDVRRMRDYVDYPRTLERFREVFPRDAGFPAVAELVLGYPYRSALYPGALEVLARVQTIGPAAIVTDGDPVYQAAKVARAGLADAVDRRVFIFAHKEAHVAELQAIVPADRYVVFDDKPEVLATVKRVDDGFRTVLVRQGHYGEVGPGDARPAPDLIVERVGDVIDLEVSRLVGEPTAG